MNVVVSIPGRTPRTERNADPLHGQQQCLPAQRTTWTRLSYTCVGAPLDPTNCGDSMRESTCPSAGGRHHSRHPDQLRRQSCLPRKLLPEVGDARIIPSLTRVLLRRCPFRPASSQIRFDGARADVALRRTTAMSEILQRRRAEYCSTPDSKSHSTPQAPWVTLCP